MKYYKQSMYAALLLLIVGVACEVNSEKFPVDFEKITEPENTGAFARVVQSQGGVWNVVELNSEEYSVTLEFDDAQDGAQVETLSFYVGYSDNAAEAIGDIPADSGDVFRTIEASDFTINEETGLPRVSTTFTSQELMDELDINNPDDVGINAAFTLRWQITTSTGKQFGPYNSGLNITGGAFYNSPFAQNITMSLAVSQDQFVGTYQLEQDAATTSGTVGLGDGYLFGPDATSTIELKVDPSNTLNGRVFKSDEGYADGLGFGTEIDSIRIAFTQNPSTGAYYTTVTNQAGTGLTCQNVSAGIVLGAPVEVSLESSWDPNSDDQFGLTIAEDALGDCAPSNPITFTLTKQ